MAYTTIESAFRFGKPCFEVLNCYQRYQCKNSVRRTRYLIVRGKCPSSLLHGSRYDLKPHRSILCSLRSSHIANHTPSGTRGCDPSIVPPSPGTRYLCAKANINDWAVSTRKQPISKPHNHVPEPCPSHAASQAKPYGVGDNQLKCRLNPTLS